VKQLQNVCGYLIVSLLGMLLIKECAVLNRNTLHLQIVFVNCSFKCFLVVFLYYSVFQKSDAKIEITITATNLVRIKYPLSSFNYHLSGANVANFNKIHCTVFEQQLFK